MFIIIIIIYLPLLLFVHFCLFIHFRWGGGGGGGGWREGENYSISLHFLNCPSLLLHFQVNSVSFKNKNSNTRTHTRARTHTHTHLWPLHHDPEINTFVDLLEGHYLMVGKMDSLPSKSNFCVCDIRSPDALSSTKMLLLLGA